MRLPEESLRRARNILLNMDPASALEVLSQEELNRLRLFVHDTDRQLLAWSAKLAERRVLQATAQERGC